MWRADEGWRYYRASYFNQSFMLFYAAPAQNLMGRYLLVDGPLHCYLRELRNRQLESNTAKARKQASAYVEQSKRVAAFRKEYDKTRSEKSRRDDMTRLSSDLRAARDLLDRTAGMELSVPYLRSRLADTVEQAEPFDGADDADQRRVSALADTLEDLMGQIRENAGL